MSSATVALNKNPVGTLIGHNKGTIGSSTETLDNRNTVRVSNSVVMSGGYWECNTNFTDVGCVIGKNSERSEGVISTYGVIKVCGTFCVVGYKSAGGVIGYNESSIGSRLVVDGAGYGNTEFHLPAIKVGDTYFPCSCAIVSRYRAGGAIGVDASSAHAFTNILFKGVLMMGAGAVIYATGRDKITELGGLAKKMPLTAGCFLISSLAIAGLPGLSGFVSKALIMDSLHEAGYTVPALLLTAGGVGTLLSITLKINWFVFFGPCEDEKVSEVKRSVPWTMNAAMLLGTAATIAIGVMPDKFYALMPYKTMVHPYHMGHVLEYVAIFIGGSIPFFLYLKKMKPHDEITLDFDWFYRKPFNRLILWISKVTEDIFKWFDHRSVTIANYLRLHFGDPTLWTANSKSVRIRNFSFENEDRLIGDIVTIIVTIFVAMLIISAIVIK